jgi:CheY-like chemotaxis protein
MTKTVLIIDDDPLIRQLLSNFLNTKYQIECKNNGQQALIWLKNGNRPDLILLDMEMPEMNGRVFIRRIKISPVHRNIPVVIISGTTSNLLKNSFMKAGATDYLVKPFSQDQLMLVVESIIGKN